MVQALYIEDDSGLAFLLSDSLANEKIQITHAQDGQSGIELFNENDFDIVLVDHDMPGLSGIDVIQHLTHSDNPPPIIMVTGAGNENVAVRAMQVGASDYVVKDVGMSYFQILPQVVFQVLGQRRLAKEHARARQMLELEKLKTQLIRDFIEAASHEFRTPLSVIQTACYMLERIDDPQQQEKYIDRIKEGTINLNKLVDDLMMLMKLDERYNLTLQTVRLSEVVAVAVDVIEERYQDRNVEIIVNNETSKAKVVGDIELLKRALKEVLDNAVRYSHDDETVTITLSGSNSKAYIRIEDKGIGISEENISKVFKRFYRVDEAHSTVGFGLGLPMAARIIELTSGDITLESELGNGTVVTLELPSNIMAMV